MFSLQPDITNPSAIPLHRALYITLSIVFASQILMSCIVEGPPTGNSQGQQMVRVHILKVAPSSASWNCLMTISTNSTPHVYTYHQITLKSSIIGVKLTTAMYDTDITDFSEIIRPLHGFSSTFVYVVLFTPRSIYLPTNSLSSSSLPLRGLLKIKYHKKLPFKWHNTMVGELWTFNS